MSNLWINWRFGAWHLQIGPDGVSFKLNAYWQNNKPERWFERCRKTTHDIHQTSRLPRMQMAQRSAS